VNSTSPNLETTQGGHCIIALLFQDSDILLHLQTRAAQSLSDVENDAEFPTFHFHVKIGEGERDLYVDC